jgi:hypothetical protein
MRALFLRTSILVAYFAQGETLKRAMLTQHRTPHYWNGQLLRHSSFRQHPTRIGRPVFPARQIGQDDRLESERGKRSHVGCLARATRAGSGMFYRPFITRGCLAMPSTSRCGPAAGFESLPKDPPQADVVTPMAAPAANWILKKQEAFDVLQAKPGWTQPGRGTLNTFQRNHQPNSPVFCDGRRSTFDGTIHQLLGFKDVQTGRRDALKGGNAAYFPFMKKMALPTQRGTKAGASPQRPR